MARPINFKTLNAQVKRELQAEKQQRIDQFALRILPDIYKKSVVYDAKDFAKRAYEIAQAMEAERTRLMNED